MWYLLRGMALEGGKSGVPAVEAAGQERRMLGHRVALIHAEESAEVPMECWRILDEDIVSLTPEVLRIVAYKGGRDDQA